MTDVATTTAKVDPQRDPRARVPYALFVPAAIGVVFLILPIVGLLIRTPWHHLPSLISSPDVRTALRLSLETATAATAIAIVVGVPIAWVLARLEFRGRALLRASDHAAARAAARCRGHRAAPCVRPSRRRG